MSVCIFSSVFHEQIQIAHNNTVVASCFSAQHNSITCEQIFVHVSTPIRTKSMQFSFLDTGWALPFFIFSVYLYNMANYFVLRAFVCMKGSTIQFPPPGLGRVDIHHVGWERFIILLWADKGSLYSNGLGMVNYTHQG